MLSESIFKCANIEGFRIDNPREFWKLLKNFDPRHKKKDKMVKFLMNVMKCLKFVNELSQTFSETYAIEFCHKGFPIC